MSKALYFYGEIEEPFETAYVIEKIDKFFDVLNVSSFSQGKLKRKVFQKPYLSPNDFRLMVHKYILITFLIFVIFSFSVFKKCFSILRHGKGPYSKDEMLHSDITQNGIKITGYTNT